MNPHTGHVGVIGRDEDPDLVPLPKRLQPAARRLLASGRDTVNLRSQSALSEFAKKKRKAKIAKASRKRNRR